MRKENNKYIEPSLSCARKRTKDEIEYSNFAFNPKVLGLGEGKTYLLKTFGCQANLSDSEKIRGILNHLGFTETVEEKEADLILLNTCAVRKTAEDRSFGEIGRIKSLKKTKHNLIIGMCGCMPQEEATINTLKTKHPEIDLVFGTHNINLLPEYLERILINKEKVIEVFSVEGNVVEGMPKVRDHKIKAWVDIMYGCDEFCTYCIVPYTRGKERSRKKEDILKEIKALVKEGYKEVTLLGQNVNAYNDGDFGFGDLLEAIAKTNIPRIRFTTSHPRDLDLRTIEVMGKYPNIMPHLHLPVQSGSNDILKKMNRKYTKEIYLEKIAKLRESVPGISLTTDIIVAFPNETESDFLDTLSLVKEAGFEGAYTFIFSKREGTPAFKYENNVLPKEAKERLLKLNEEINQGFLKGNKRFEKEIVKVLVDGFSDKDESVLSGYTEHNKLVNFNGDKSLIGKIANVKITKAYTWHLKGELQKWKK